jgi:hypothetical protein
VVLQDEFDHHIDQEDTFDDALSQVEVGDLGGSVATLLPVDNASVDIVAEGSEVGIEKAAQDAEEDDETLEGTVEDGLGGGDDEVILERALALLLALLGL